MEFDSEVLEVCVFWESEESKSHVSTIYVPKLPDNDATAPRVTVFRPPIDESKASLSNHLRSFALGQTTTLPADVRRTLCL